MMNPLSSAAEQTSARCVSCATLLAGKFCHACGEKAFDPHDHSFRRFAEELLHTVTHLDSKFLKSLKTLCFKPGALTNEYLAGRKKLFTEQLARSLIILQIPLLALLTNALYITRRRFFFDHLIFATHFYSFMLWVNIALTLGIFLYFKLGGNVYNLEAPLFLLTGAYFIMAARNVYRQNWLLTIVKGVLLTASFVLTLFAYRIILFLATFLSV